jgi:alpha-N-acetylglucosamine transferase
MQHYASRHGLDFHDIEPVSSQPLNFGEIQLVKLAAMRQALAVYERVIWIDSDVLVRPDSPNLLDLVPENRFGAFDEISRYRLLGGSWV